MQLIQAMTWLGNEKPEELATMAYRTAIYQVREGIAKAENLENILDKLEQATVRLVLFPKFRITQ